MSDLRFETVERFGEDDCLILDLGRHDDHVDGKVM